MVKLEKKTYSLEEIKKIAPNYRGKPENFDPEFKRRKAQAKKPTESRRSKPIIENDAEPLPQKADELWPFSIFGIGVKVMYVGPRESFLPTYARIPEVMREMYMRLAADDCSLYKKLTVEMLNYYSTALLWARLIDLKAKSRNTCLTQTEMNFRRYFQDKEFNVPDPLAFILQSIGHVEDPRGFTLYLEDHSLPTAHVGRKGGYHDEQIDVNSHNLYEEIPTLGVMGDVLEAVASEEAHPVPQIPILPEHTVATENLLGYRTNIPVRKWEIRQILNSFGVYHNQFYEDIPNTRFNILLVNYISNTLAGMHTFHIDKTNMTEMSQNGWRSQLIRSVPSTDNQSRTRWTEADVQPRSVCADHTLIGFAYYAGYQLMKEPFDDDNLVWCCVQSAPEHQWKVPVEWIDNRNDRRRLPADYKANFVAMYDSQVHRTTACTGRMISCKAMREIHL